MEARDAHSGDMESWLRIRRTIWPHASLKAHEKDIEAGFAREDGRRFVVLEEEGGAEVAFVECRMGLKEDRLKEDGLREGAPAEDGLVEDAQAECVGRIEAWYIVPKYRVGGIGRALLAFLREWFQPRGCTRLKAPPEFSADVFLRANTDQPTYDIPMFFVPANR